LSVIPVSFALASFFSVSGSSRIILLSRRDFISWKIDSGTVTIINGITQRYVVFDIGFDLNASTLSSPSPRTTETTKNTRASGTVKPSDQMGFIFISASGLRAKSFMPCIFFDWTRSFILSSPVSCAFSSTASRSKTVLSLSSCVAASSPPVDIRSMTNANPSEATGRTM